MEMWRRQASCCRFLSLSAYLFPLFLSNHERAQSTHGRSGRAESGRPAHLARGTQALLRELGAVIREAQPPPPCASAQPAGDNALHTKLALADFSKSHEAAAAGDSDRLGDSDSGGCGGEVDDDVSSFRMVDKAPLGPPGLMRCHAVASYVCMDRPDAREGQLQVNKELVCVTFSKLVYGV